MKKFILSTGVVVIFALYAIHLKTDDENKNVQIQTPQSLVSDTPTPLATATTTTIVNPTQAPTAVPVQKGKYKDGSYTGPVTDAFYGNVQVKAVITGGKISDVIFLQYPNDRNTSVEINSQAMPFLKQEAIQAQSAKVDGVSGATQTSRAFIQSLDSALQQAI